ncbi:barstar family protein [Streptomyces sp. NPDC089919]|uniref:barstar family protein n=1 Tax=Streptomyces sp. NPDC089919 TaxID=3155188 RepID=UPI0034245B38
MTVDPLEPTDPLGEPAGLRVWADGDPLAPALAAAAEAGWRTYRLDLAGVRSRAALMDRCAQVLDLPPWFGRNWDALADCLTDLSWEPEVPGRLLALTSWSRYAAARPREAEVLQEVLESVVDHWRESGAAAFTTLLVSGVD